MWKARGSVPAEHCPAIEAYTRRIADEKAEPSMVVTCEQLRDDVQWGVLRTAPAAELITRGDGTVTSDERHPQHDPAFVKRVLASEGPQALDPDTPVAMPRRRSGEAGGDKPRCASGCEHGEA